MIIPYLPAPIALPSLKTLARRDLLEAPAWEALWGPMLDGDAEPLRTALHVIGETVHVQPGLLRPDDEMDDDEAWTAQGQAQQELLRRGYKRIGRPHKVVPVTGSDFGQYGVRIGVVVRGVVACVRPPGSGSA